MSEEGNVPSVSDEEEFEGRQCDGFFATYAQAGAEAFDGFWRFIRTCKPIRIQFVLFLLGLGGGWWRGFGPLAYLVVIGLFFAGLYAESQNTTQEQICNSITRRYSQDIRIAKHYAAGGVFVVFIAAVVIYVFLLCYPQLGAMP